MVVGSRLPGWVALGLAVVTFLGLHGLAHYLSLPVAAQNISDLGPSVQRALFAGIASVLQIVVPLAFVAGAVISSVKGARVRAVFDRVAAHGTSTIGNLSWSEFERLIGEGFRRRGYAVRGNETAGADGGVDLELVKGSERFLVQCKHWRRSSVGVTVIREFFGVMTARSANGGFVVTSGSFTPDAWGFAAQCQIELIDGERLEGWMSQAQGPEKASTATRRNDLMKPGAVVVSSLHPACPRCGVEMVLRTARRGASIGHQFWGCSRFPQCRETRQA
jgi:restriction system protein